MSKLTFGGAGSVSFGGAGSALFKHYPTAAVISAQPSAITLARPSYLTPIAIPELDTRIVRISDAATMGGSYRFYKHLYSKHQPWNCDESWMLLEHTDGLMRLLNGQTYALLNQPTTWNANPQWHATDPYKLWATDLISTAGKVKELTINPSTYAATIREIDLGTGGYGGGYTGWYGNGGGEGSPSNDGRYAVIIGKSSTAIDVICFDYVTETRAGTLVISQPSWEIGVDVDWAGMSQSGDYMIVAYNSAAAGYKYEVYNRSMVLQRTLTCTGLGHSDLGYDSAGNEVLVFVGGVTGREYEVTTYRLSDGTLTKQLDATHMASNFHLSCRNIARPGYAYISTWDNPGDTTTKYMYNEIFAIKLDGSGLIERFAQNWAANAAADILYQRMAMAVPNRDGSRLLFASDWDDATGSAVIYDYIAGMP